jgi:hypothetical protein
MKWHVVTVSKHDLGLTLGAIGIGGGTVTATRPEQGQVVITYVTYARVPSARAV